MTPKGTSDPTPMDLGPVEPWFAEVASRAAGYPDWLPLPHVGAGTWRNEDLAGLVRSLASLIHAHRGPEHATTAALAVAASILLVPQPRADFAVQMDGGLLQVAFTQPQTPHPAPAYLPDLVPLTTTAQGSLPTAALATLVRQAEVGLPQFTLFGSVLTAAAIALAWDNLVEQRKDGRVWVFRPPPAVAAGPQQVQMVRYAAHHRVSVAM
jgi:hypothetical protein